MDTHDSTNTHDAASSDEQDRREAVTAADDTGLVLQQENLVELAFRTPVADDVEAKP